MRKPPAVPLLLAGMLLLIVWQFGALPGHGSLIGELQSLGHFPLFGSLAAILFLLVRFHSPLAHRPAGHSYATTFAMMLALSLTAEWSQQFTDRDASFGDVLINLAGTAAALSLIALFDTRLAAITRPRSVRLGLAALPLALGASVALPVIEIAAALMKRNADFPCIVCPKNRLDLRLLKPRGASLSLDRDEKTGDWVLLVHLQSGGYPGVVWDHPIADWRGYQTLVLDLTNPEPIPLRLILRIDDREKSFDFTDRFNHRLNLPARTRLRERIPLLAIENAPKGRQMELEHIADLALYSTAQNHRRQFYLHSIHLE